jgi:lysozyme
MAKTENILFSIMGLAIGAVVLEWYLSSQQVETLYNPDMSFDPFAPPSPLFQPTVPFMQYSTSGMVTSPAGLQNIAHWEGRRNQAYQDIAGNWSIGIGHLIVPGDGLNSTSYINDATVDAIFANDIAEAENIVQANVTVPLTQGQFDALVDFSFQFGNDLATSTLLKKLNAVDYVGAASELNRWVMSRNSAGKLVQVTQLVQRRAAATAMFG